MKTKAHAPGKKRLTDLDESILFLSRPYGIAAAVCWVLSLYCIATLWNDKQSASFILSVLTISVDTVLLAVLFWRAKRVGREQER